MTEENDMPTHYTEHPVYYQYVIGERNTKSLIKN